MSSTSEDIRCLSVHHSLNWAWRASRLKFMFLRRLLFHILYNSFLTHLVLYLLRLLRPSLLRVGGLLFRLFRYDFLKLIQYGLVSVHSHLRSGSHLLLLLSLRNLVRSHIIVLNKFNLINLQRNWYLCQLTLYFSNHQFEETKDSLRPQKEPDSILLAFWIYCYYYFACASKSFVFYYSGYWWMFI
jgi:hypothetical protein